MSEEQEPNGKEDTGQMGEGESAASPEDHPCPVVNDLFRARKECLDI